jgi:hypothetical protein
MKTMFCTRVIIALLLMTLVLSACGTHPDPLTREPVKSNFNDFLAAALGWESWESLSMGGPVLIGSTSMDGPSDFVLAYPNAMMVGSVGDKILNSMLETGAGSVIGPGEAYAARVQTSLYAIQQAFSGNPNARMYIDPTGRWLAAFLPNGNAWYMGFIDLTKKSMFQFCQQLQNCGSFITAGDASSLTKEMEKLKWVSATPSMIPATIRTYFLTKMGWLKGAWFVRMNGVTASPLFVLGQTFMIPNSILLPNSIDWENLPQQ